MSVDLLDIRSAARQLGVSPATLKLWIRLGKSPKILKLSKRCFRIRQEDLQDWLDSQADSPEKEFSK